MSSPVCTTCNDTHMMMAQGRPQLCTHCPVPCQKCRKGGNGAYCEHTPCNCSCHLSETMPITKIGKQKARELKYQFKGTLEREHNLVGHPKADLLFEKAWDLGHASGLQDVESYYADLAELIK